MPRGAHPTFARRTLSLFCYLAATAPSLLAAGAMASGHPVSFGSLPPALGVPAPTTNTSTLDLGMPLNASVNVSQITGGSGNPANLNFTWLGLPANCTTQNVSNYTCFPTAAGTVSISVKVTDTSDSRTATSVAVNITVNTDPVLTSFTVTPTSVGVNGSLTFTAVASGGTAPLTYLYSGLPSGCSGNTSTLTCTPRVAQAYKVFVTAVDALGMSSSATLNVSVNVTAATKTTASSGPTAVEWGIIVAILVVGFAVSAVLFVRARREERQTYGRRPPPTPPGTGSMPPSSSAGTPPPPSPPSG